MNASFRTAFWAMCLGLAVPMILFVGVELTSGGRAARRATASADNKSGLATGNENTQPKVTTRKKSRDGKSSPPVVASKKDRETPPAALDSIDEASPEIAERDPGDARVFFDQEIEPDSAAPEADEQRDRRVPAIVTHSQNGRAPLARPEPTSVSSLPVGAEIEARLAGIQRNLEDLGRELARQGERDRSADPLKQAAEILRQLRDAREVEKLADRSSNAAPEIDEAREAPPEGDLPPVPEPVEPQPIPSAEVAERKKSPRPLTRIYRPRHIGSRALKALIMPLLTEGVGKAGAAEADPGAGAPVEAAEAGAPGTDALVVHDFPEVLRKIDLLVRQVDVAPAKVVLEATVITVGLHPGMPQGIDLLSLNATGRPFAIRALDGAAGKGALLPAPGKSDSQFLTHGFGLKCGVLTGDPRGFLAAVQGMTQMRRTSAWQMTVLNRQSAELMLNDPFGAGGGGSDAPVGTRLRIRPVVERDGRLRLDVKRDAEDAAASGTRAAALTYQFLLQEGQTAVVAGFLAEQVTAYDDKTFSGRLFRKQLGFVDETETILLLTPHVVGGEQAPSARKDRTQSRTARQVGPTAIARKSQEAPKVGPAPSPVRRSAEAQLPVLPPAQSVGNEAASSRPQALAEGEAKPIELTGAEVQAATMTGKQPAGDDLDSIPPLVLPEEGPQIRPAVRPQAR